MSFFEVSALREAGVSQDVFTSPSFLEPSVLCICCSFFLKHPSLPLSTCLTSYACFESQLQCHFPQAGHPSMGHTPPTVPCKSNCHYEVSLWISSPPPLAPDSELLESRAARCMATWHLREAWEAFQISGPTSDLLNQNPNFNKIPRTFQCTLKNTKCCSTPLPP